MQDKSEVDEVDKYIRVFCDCTVLIKLKRIFLYMIAIRLAMLYGIKYWAVKNKMSVTEMRMLR
jgi:hypothetical protein